MSDFTDRMRAAQQKQVAEKKTWEDDAERRRQQYAESAAMIRKLTKAVVAELQRAKIPTDFTIIQVTYRDVRKLFGTKREEIYEHVASGWWTSKKETRGQSDGYPPVGNLHIEGSVLVTDGRIFDYSLNGGFQIHDDHVEVISSLPDSWKGGDRNGPLEDYGYHSRYDGLVAGLIDLSIRHGLDPQSFE
ncbi:hypothetical protein ACFXAW_30260 [Streptomyces sp. NPDC059445]|uniref:hypothetical protein n=1 Tax=Streptomyces sp. NPDC059445 TaxID=3346832 RepID=UPI00367D1F22